MLILGGGDDGGVAVRGQEVLRRARSGLVMVCSTGQFKEGTMERAVREQLVDVISSSRALYFRIVKMQRPTLIAELTTERLRN